jgi:hypothetical protein
MTTCKVRDVSKRCMLREQVHQCGDMLISEGSFCDCRKSGSTCLCKRHELSAWRNTLNPSVTEEKTVQRLCINIRLRQEKQVLCEGNSFRSRQFLQTQLGIADQRNFFKCRYRNFNFVRSHSVSHLYRLISCHSTGSTSIQLICDLNLSFKDCD